MCVCVCVCTCVGERVRESTSVSDVVYVCVCLGGTECFDLDPIHPPPPSRRPHIDCVHVHLCLRE